MSPAARLVVGRDADENGILEKLADVEDSIFTMADITGPYGLGKGVFTPEDRQTAAALLARYSRDRGKETTTVNVRHKGIVEKIVVKPGDDQVCDALRIADVVGQAG
jgi:predicted ribosome quality control (RQC) complex YloA/Tae2 family protein